MIHKFRKAPSRPRQGFLSWVAGICFLIFAAAVVFGIAQNPTDNTEEAAATRAEQRAIELADGFRVTDLLFVAATHLAEERGLIYTRLMEGSSETPGMRAKIAARRAASSQALDQAANLVAGTIEMPGRDRTLKAIVDERTRVEKLRHEVDAWHPDETNKLAVRLSANWFASTSRLIAATEDLLVLVHHKLRGKDPEVDISLKLQHLAWIMSEFAARERGLTSGAIAENRLPQRYNDWTRVAVFRRFNNAWQTARNITSNHNISPEILAAMEDIERGFILDLKRVRDDLKRASINQSPFPIAASVWFSQSTDAIKPMVRLGRLAGEVARKRSLSPRVQRTGAVAYESAAAWSWRAALLS